MKTSRFSRLMTVVLLMVILLLAVPLTEASSTGMTASPAPAPRSSVADALRRDVTLENCDPAYSPNACVVDQSMVNFNGRQVFGGNTVLSQTFRPTANKAVCKVNVRIRKVVNRPSPAGDLVLSVRTMGGVVLDSAVRPANLIPMGDSVQSFDLGCNGGVLVAGNLYRIVLRERAIAAPLIRIVMQLEDDALHVTVADNAGGIRGQPIESIFDPITRPASFM